MLTAERVRELLDYDSETGVFTWKISPARAVPVGRIAGVVEKHGYRRIAISGKRYLAHRLAWLHINGIWPSDELDHVDGNPDNNAIGNLRAATRLQNSANMRKNARNTSGFKGVYWEKQQQAWRARVSHDNARVDLGFYPTREAAHEAYCAAAMRIHGEFARME